MDSVGDHDGSYSYYSYSYYSYYDYYYSSTQYSYYSYITYSYSDYYSYSYYYSYSDYYYYDYYSYSDYYSYDDSYCSYVCTDTYDSYYDYYSYSDYYYYDYYSYSDYYYYSYYDYAITYSYDYPHTYLDDLASGSTLFSDKSSPYSDATDLTASSDVTISVGDQSSWESQGDTWGTYNRHPDALIAAYNDSSYTTFVGTDKHDIGAQG